MKKLIAIALFSIASQAHAVLCVVQTSDPRYNVASYIRNQTSCNTTQYAGGPSLTRLAVSIVALGLIVKFIDIISSESKKEEFVNSVTDKNAKVYSCKGIDVISTENVSYVGIEGKFLELSKSDKAFYQGKFDEGMIRFDPDLNMVMGQKWGEKTAKGSRCTYQGRISEL